MMKNTVGLIGIGEMGGVFARGFLKAGYPVYPMTRGADLKKAASRMADLMAVVVGVGEKDLPEALRTMPEKWRDRLILLQNELLPRDWLAYQINDPTVISVWFEKKPGQDVKVLIPSPVYGPHALLVKEALGKLAIECVILKDADELLFERVLKNVYILTVNSAGLVVGGTVGELWEKHQDLAREVADNVMDIQFRLIGRQLNRTQLIEGMVRAFHGDLDHKCMGRSAPQRLKRAVGQADEFGLDTDKLREIYQRQRQAAVK